MALKFSPALAAYRALWEPALWSLRALAATETLLERLPGNLALPSRWRPCERLALPRAAQDSTMPRLWLHAASLGECKGLWAFARTLADLPCGFVLTANTVEARDFLAARAASTEAPERWTARLAPPDHPRLLRRFRRAYDVRGLVLFEMELWPHAIREMRRAEHPVFWISARWTAKAARRYGAFSRATRTVFSRITWTQAHGEEEARRLRSLGCEDVEVGGDLRGLLYLDEASPATAGPREGIAFVSFHADELKALTVMLRGLRGPAWVLPRKPSEFARFREALAPLGFEDLSGDPRTPLRLVDALGHTREILARAGAAVVGGSFRDHGGHNLWEPLVAGIPAATGLHHESQAWLASRLRLSGMLRILPENPGNDAESALGALLREGPSPERLRDEAERAREALRAAAERVRDMLERHVSFTERR